MEWVADFAVAAHEVGWESWYQVGDGVGVRGERGKKVAFQASGEEPVRAAARAGLEVGDGECAFEVLVCEG